jgi:RhoGAP domain
MQGVYHVGILKNKGDRQRVAALLAPYLGVNLAHFGNNVTLGGAASSSSSSSSSSGGGDPNFNAVQTVDDVCEGLLLYLSEGKQPLVPVHLHSKLLFEFIKATDDASRTEALRSTIGMGLTTELTSIFHALMDFFYRVHECSSVNGMSIPEIATVMAPVIFPNPAKPNPKLIDNRPFIALHLLLYHPQILPADRTHSLAAHSAGAPLLSPRPPADMGFAPLPPNAELVHVQANAQSKALRLNKSDSVVGGGLSFALRMPPDALSPRDGGGGDPHSLSGSVGSAESVGDVSGDAEDGAFVATTSAAALIVASRNAKTHAAEVTVSNTTSPSQDQSLIGGEAMLERARSDPAGFWDTASRGHIPTATVVDIVSHASLSQAQRDALIAPLLRELVPAECLASNGTATKRGCTHLYKSLCGMVLRRLESLATALSSSSPSPPESMSASSSESPESLAVSRAKHFYADLDLFLSLCDHPGETCFSLNAFTLALVSLDIVLDSHLLVQILCNHLPRLGEFKQQAQLAFFPWMDVQKLVMPTVDSNQAQAQKIVARLKKQYRLRKRVNKSKPGARLTATN